MNAGKIVFTLMAGALFLCGGCSAPKSADGFPPFSMRSSTPEHITLKTFGADGQKFSGTLVVDGVHREISGVTPAEYPIDCIMLTGVVTNSSPERFGFEVVRTNSNLFTPGTEQVCRFRYHAGGMEVLRAR